MPRPRVLRALSLHRGGLSRRNSRIGAFACKLGCFRPWDMWTAGAQLKVSGARTSSLAPMRTEDLEVRAAEDALIRRHARVPRDTVVSLVWRVPVVGETQTHDPADRG